MSEPAPRIRLRPRLVAAVLPFLLPLPASAADVVAGPEVVVTATRVPTPRSHTGATVHVIDAAEIERRQYRTLTEALQSVPGLSVVRNGGPGKLTSVFSRGSNANHTLVLVDGMELNDPSGPDGRVDLSRIQLDDVARIEVVPGTHSTLYGSDAVGAVIQVITRTGAGPARARVSLEAGSLATFNQYAAVRGARGPLSYSLGVQHTDTGGVSALDADFAGPGGALDADGHRDTTLSTRLVYTPTDTLELDLSLRRSDARDELDLNSFPVRDDPDSRNDSELLMAGLDVRVTALDGRSQHRLGVSRVDSERHDRDDPDAVNTADYLRDDNEGVKTRLELQNDFYVLDDHVLTVGLERERDEVRSRLRSRSEFGPFDSDVDADITNNAIYVQDQYRHGALSGSLGLRVDDHERFDRETTWRLAAGYALDARTRVRGSYATGFKAPTANQLFGSSVSAFSTFTGNPDLRPETSRGWELGVTRGLWDGRAEVDVVYYDTRIEDLITFSDDFTTNVNRDRVDTRGVELGARADVSDDLALGVDYSYTRAEDAGTGEELRRRPLHKAVVHADYTPGRWRLSVEGITIGRRYDTDALTAARIRRGGYFLLNVAADYRLTPDWSLFGRVDNALDRDYQEPHGFSQPGVTGFLGVRYAPR